MTRAQQFDTLTRMLSVYFDLYMPNDGTCICDCYAWSLLALVGTSPNRRLSF